MRRPRHRRSQPPIPRAQPMRRLRRGHQREAYPPTRRGWPTSRTPSPSGPAWPIASTAAKGRALWLHQANALQALEQGKNIVVATSTASGKSLIIRTWTLHRLKQDPEATALVFYPTKALANDQARRWHECCETLKMDPETVGQVDGDVKTDDRRKAVMEQSKIIIATPDVCHAWILQDFPGSLRQEIRAATQRPDHRQSPHLRVRFRQQLSLPVPPAHGRGAERGSAKAAQDHRRHRNHPGTGRAPGKADRTPLHGDLR